jgi:hypothetical protein
MKARIQQQASPALLPTSGSVALHDWKHCIATDCEACEQLADECDCQDAENGFISNECPIHNLYPSSPPNH